MGTHCYIALEDKDDKTVRYVYIHYDGYFSNIVPLLKKYYTVRKDVERLINSGVQSSLLLPNELYVCEDEELKPTTVKHRYIFESEAQRPELHIEYFYLFNKDDHWECQCTSMFSIDELKY